MRILALVATLLSLPASDARACHNGVEHAVNPLVSRLRRAERALTTGHLRRAFRTAQRVHRSARRPRDAALRGRAERVMAVTAVRLRGDVDLASSRRSPEERRAGENIDWATQTLRRLHAARPHDVVLAARLAEALTLDAATQREAYDLLTPLSDVLPDTFAFRTMAILLERFGEEGQSERVLRECMRRTHGAGRGVCRPIS